MRNGKLSFAPLALAGAVALSLSACVTVEDGKSQGHSGQSRTAAKAAPMSEQDMAAYCRGEASAKFGIKPQYITTLPVESSGSGSTVYGEFDDGGKTKTFECKFDNSGKFRSVSAS